MTHQPLKWPEINPFCYVSLRSWFKWLLIFVFAIAIQWGLFQRNSSISSRHRI